MNPKAFGVLFALACYLYFVLGVELVTTHGWVYAFFAYFGFYILVGLYAYVRNDEDA